jgi:hypothetical protein
MARVKVVTSKQLESAWFVLREIKMARAKKITSDQIRSAWIKVGVMRGVAEDVSLAAFKRDHKNAGRVHGELTNVFARAIDALQEAEKMLSEYEATL